MNKNKIQTEKQGVIMFVVVHCLKSLIEYGTCSHTRNTTRKMWIPPRCTTRLNYTKGREIHQSLFIPSPKYGWGLVGNPKFHFAFSFLRKPCQLEPKMPMELFRYVLECFLACVDQNQSPQRVRFHCIITCVSCTFFRMECFWRYSRVLPSV